VAATDLSGSPAATVFGPARLGPVILKNRIIKSATFEGAAPRGEVTETLVDFHRRVAAGGVGMTTVAYLAVSPEGRTDRHCVLLSEEALPGLRRLTDAVHDAGAAASAQIGHAGPVANGRSNGRPSLAPTRRLAPTGQLTRAVTEQDIERITREYANGARLAVEAGFDCIEVHLGHNYLLSAFLSPKLNRRTDQWGGSLAHRARFRMLESEGVLDALELTGGSSLSNPMYLFRGEAPLREFGATLPAPMQLGFRAVGAHFLKAYPLEEAYFLPYARQFLDALSMPLILLGGVNRLETVENALAEGFSFVAMARALLREPDLVGRWEKGSEAEGLCIHCNKCMPTIYSGTRCVLVPEAESAAG
jgi:2,4-dienoyl-CoA reductase-like NADH-dependent reductase (Old Yellow Enzyme family)